MGPWSAARSPAAGGPGSARIPKPPHRRWGGSPPNLTATASPPARRRRGEHRQGWIGAGEHHLAAGPAAGPRMAGPLDVLWRCWRAWSSAPPPPELRALL